MHSSLDFERYDIREELMDLFDEWEYESNTDEEDMKNIIKEMRKRVDEEEVFELPYKLTSTIYTNDEGMVESVKFTVALTKADDELKIEKYRKKTFTVDASVSFFDDFIFELSKFFDGYYHGLMLQDNLEEFNRKIWDIIDRDAREHDDSKVESIESLMEIFNMDGRIKTIYDNRKDIHLYIRIINMILECIKVVEHQNGNKSKKQLEAILNKDVSNIFMNTVFENRMYDNKDICGTDFNGIGVGDMFDELLDEISDIIGDVQPQKNKLDISFGYGKGFLDISDQHAVIGLSEDVIMKLDRLSLFNKLINEIAKGYTNIILAALEKCDKSYDLVNVNNIFTRDIGIQDGTKIHNIIKKSFGKLRLNGESVGYYSNKDIITVIEVKKATESDIKKGNCFIGTIGEDLALKFKVKPFNISTKEQVELTLEEIISDIRDDNK